MLFIKEKHWEQSVILVATVSMRQRIIPWERAVRFSFRMTDTWNLQKSYGKREQTAASISVDRLINIPGWAMDRPICQAI